MKIGRRIMSLVVSSSSPSPSLSLLRVTGRRVSLTVCCLLKNPECLQMSSSGFPPLFCLHRSILPPALHPLIPSPFSPLPLTQFELLHPSSLCLFYPSLFHLFIFFHTILQSETASNRDEEEKGEEAAFQTGRESKSSGEEKTIPFVTDEAFIDKGGLSHNFLLLFFVVYLFPCYPFPSFVPECLRHRGRLSGINKDGCWQIKVMGRDGGLLNIQFTSHKSPPVSRRLVMATSCNKQLKTHANVLQGEA